MRYELLRAGDERTWAVIFEAGDEAAGGLARAADTCSKATQGPTLEVLGTESPGHLRRGFNPDFGIALIDLAGGADEPQL